MSKSSKSNEEKAKEKLLDKIKKVKETSEEETEPIVHVYGEPIQDLFITDEEMSSSDYQHKESADMFNKEYQNPNFYPKIINEILDPISKKFIQDNEKYVDSGMTKKEMQSRLDDEVIRDSIGTRIVDVLDNYGYDDESKKYIKVPEDFIEDLYIRTSDVLNKELESYMNATYPPDEQVDKDIPNDMRISPEFKNEEEEEPMSDYYVSNEPTETYEELEELGDQGTQTFPEQPYDPIEEAHQRELYDQYKQEREMEEFDEEQKIRDLNIDQANRNMLNNIRMRAVLEAQEVPVDDYVQVEEEIPQEEIPQEAMPREELRDIRLEAMERRGIEQPRLNEVRQERGQQLDEREGIREEERRQVRKEAREEELKRLKEEKVNRLKLSTAINEPYARPYPYDTSTKNKVPKKQESKRAEEKQKSSDLRLITIYQDYYLKNNVASDIRLAQTHGMLGYQLSKNSGPVIEYPANNEGSYIDAIKMEANDGNSLLLKIGIDERYDINIGDLYEGKYTVNPNLAKITKELYNKKLFSKEDYSIIENIAKKRNGSQDDYDKIKSIICKYKKLKWTPDEVKKGKKDIRNKTFDLLSSIKTTGYVKVKYLEFQNSLVRLRNKYLFLAKIKNGEANNYFEEDDFVVGEKFKRQINKFLFSEMNFNPFRAAKRMYYYSNFEDKKIGNPIAKDYLSILSKYFNSDTPDIFEALDRICALIIIKPNKNIIDATLKYIEVNSNNLDKLSKELKNIVDEDTIEFMEKNNLIPLPTFFIPKVIKYI